MQNIPPNLNHLSLHCIDGLKPGVNWTVRWILFFSISVFLPGCGDQHASLPPAKAIAQGWDHYNEALYDDAERLFSDAVHDTPEADESHLQALYGQATTINLRRPGGNPTLAQPIYQRITTLSPRSDWAAWSQLALARMVALPPSGEMPELARVVDAYQKVIARFPLHKAGEEAFVFQQSARVSSFDEGEVRKAAALLEQFVVEHPQSAFLSHSYRLLSRAHENTAEPEKALAALLKFHETYKVDPRNPRSDYASVYWIIATLANYRVGDFVTARRYFNLLIDEYPTERRVFTAKLMLHQMDETEARLRAAPARP